jgi:hypothetical protein
MKAIVVDLHPNNINREDGLTLSQALEPILRLLKGNNSSRSSSPSSNHAHAVVPAP